ncbi:MAG: aspartate carbamoyltransferase, partial [Gammaproteobacteria bacterium]|nr:aspartate carbamoyltransferase [Gammaproteobacteria bacterium]
GDLKNGRALHSLLKVLSVFNNLQIHLVSPPNLETPEDIVQILHDRNHRVEVFHNLTEGIEHVDILYVTRTQEERFESQQDADRYRGLFRINRQIYTQHCEPNTVIMHPLPRDSREEAQELDEDLDEHPNLAIFRQTDNGINIRMALFALVMNVVDHIEDSAREVRWHSGVQQHN